MSPALAGGFFPTSATWENKDSFKKEFKALVISMITITEKDRWLFGIFCVSTQIVKFFVLVL